MLLRAALALSLHLTVNEDFPCAAEPDDNEDDDGNADDDANDDSDNGTCRDFGCSTDGIRIVCAIVVVV